MAMAAKKPKTPKASKAPKAPKANKSAGRRAVIQRGNSAKPGPDDVGKKPRGRPFAPGNPHAFQPGDPRINRNGRPKSHDELRALIQDLASDVDIDGRSRIETMLLSMFNSSQPADKANILEHGWGKVPQAHKIGGDKDNPLVIESADKERASKELDEWRKQKIAELSGLNVVPTPPTS